MSKIKYSFELKKSVVVRFPKGVVNIGEVEDYQDINGKVSVTIKLQDKLPKELLKILSDDPRLISIVGVPSEISKAELVDGSMIITPE